MKTKILKQAVAIVITGVLSTFYVHSQTALSGTGSNTCGAGNAGTANTFVGCTSGNAIQAGGIDNSGLGQLSLAKISTGDRNVGIGYNAGGETTTGSRNTIIGWSAGLTLTTANDNTFTGHMCGYSNTTGFNNAFYGDSTGYFSQGSDYCTFIGMDAGKGTAAYSADVNTFIGYRSGYKITTGDKSLFSGTYSGYETTTGQFNTFLGYNCAGKNTTGYYNTFVGYAAGYFNTTGHWNTMMGNQAGYDATTCVFNAFFGNEAGLNNTSGSYNTFLGAQAGDTHATGSNNTFIGYGADATNVYSNSTALGNGASSNDDNDIVLGNGSIETLRCFITTITGLSDRRVKDNIQENVVGLDFIKLLRPVTYHYNVDRANEIVYGEQQTQYDSLGNEILNSWDTPGKYNKEVHQVTGFIAQEVDSAANLIGYDFSGVEKPEDESRNLWGIRYAEFVVPLVKAVQEQQVQIEELKNEIRLCCSAPSNKKMDNNSGNVIQGEQGKYTGEQDNATLVELRYSDNIVLYQNIPNPFGEETTINFYLPEIVKTAKMVFYDNMGKTIKEVMISQKGNASLIVRSSELSTGVYSYSLVVDDKIVATKMMVKNK